MKKLKLKSVILGSAVVLGGVAIGLGGALTTAQAGQRVSAAPARTGADCARIAGLRLDNVEIESARIQAADAVIEGARLPDMTGTPQGKPVSGLPALCRVVGSIHPAPGSNIKFEVWMPLNGWNGRFFGANNGGLAGSIRFDDIAAAIRNGAAGAGSDTGHDYRDPKAFLGKPEVVKDYGWRAIHETTVVSKRIVQAFYGRGPQNSYFVGCSGGGRMALMEASRFPADYDGIVAGAPHSELTLAMLNAYQVQRAPEAKIRPDQTPFLQQEVLRQCDALDGQRDGLIVNPLQCKLDYSALTCGKSDSKQCFTPAQVVTLRHIREGVRDASGKRLAYGFPHAGSEVGLSNVGWEGTLMSARSTGLAGAIMEQFLDPPINSETFDFARDSARFHQRIGPVMEFGHDLRPFFQRGGKLILWHGWADPILPPEPSIDIYNEVRARSGPRAAQQMRLFMVPNVQHCTGGAGADAFGQVGAAPIGTSPERSVAAAITAWVEGGRVPSSVIGQHGQNSQDPAKRTTGPVLERKHCAWPMQAALRRGADPDKGESYVCRAPGRS